jgi:CheY-like chemotaxis protein
MSKLFNSPITPETSPQASGQPLPTWQVKLSNGTVYGPIEQGELRTWAEECRLAPGDQVSSDTVHWVNAETLSELAMQWMVDMVSGEIFGPVNLHAVVDFFHSHLVMPDSRLTNRVTGEVATVADLVLPLIHNAARDAFPAGAPVMTENSASADRLIKFNQGTTTTRLPPDQQKEKLQHRIDLLQTKVDESKACIRQLQGDLDSQQAQTLKLRNDTATIEKKYLVKIEDVQKNYDLAADMIKQAEAQVQALNAALEEKEQYEANAAHDWDAIQSEKENQIQTLTRQVEVLTADQTAIHAVLEQNREELEQARQETQKLATRAKELNARIPELSDQIQDMSDNLAMSEDDVAGQRERIEAMTGEHLQKETQLQTGFEKLTGRINALNPELEPGRDERVISMEKSVVEAGNKAEEQKISSPGIQEQPVQTKDEVKQDGMLWSTEKAELERGYPESLEEKSSITPGPDLKKISRKRVKKVLVVDDSEIIQQLITKLAENYGASVTAVASARDVTRILAEQDGRFDLFILDLILPGITGWEIIGILRARPETKDTPIVVLSGPLSPQEQGKILQKANAIIEKSKFTITDFNKVLNQWL